MNVRKYPTNTAQLKAALPAVLFIAGGFAQTPAVAQTSAADEAIEEITVTGTQNIKPFVTQDTADGVANRCIIIFTHEATVSSNISTENR